MTNIIRCEGLKDDGAPCTKYASHVWRGQHACCWHGDPARRRSALRNMPQRRWTLDALEELNRLTERGWSDERIGRSLGVKAHSVERARYDYKLPPRRRITLDATDVARMFQHRNSRKVTRWIRIGALSATPGYKRGRQTTHHIEYADLELFLADERYWHLWTPDDLTNKTLLRDCGRPDGIRYYTTRQVADICCVSEDAPCKWCARGWLKSVRHGKDYLVRSDWLDAFRQVWSYGDGITRRDAA